MTPPFALVDNVTSPEEGSRPSDLLIAMVLPDTGLWFVYALAIFSALTWAVWRVPVWLQLGSAGVLAVLAASGALQLTNYAWNAMALHLVFFIIGRRGRSVIEAVVATLTTRRVLVLVVFYAAASSAVAALDAHRVPGVALLVSLLAVSAGVAAAAAVSGTLVGRPLRFLGQRTIDIYLPHVMVIAGLTALIDTAAGPTIGAVALGLLAALIVVAVVLSLAAAGVLRRAGANFLFRLPGASASKARSEAA